MRLLLRLSILLLLFFIILAVCLYKTEPILIKWAIGTARIIGVPSDARVYTNGKINTGIKVYRINRYWDGSSANSYILQLSEFDKYGMLHYIYIDLKEGWVGRPACTANDCYRVILGNLFQSETGGKFTPFNWDMKGFNFDPQLTSINTQITFKVPPNLLSFDSIRIVL